MEILKDFKELLGLFGAHKVEYLIVGGYALAFYGAPRFTSPNNVIQLGVPPVRVDIMTSLTAVGWEKAQANKVQANYGDTPTYFISKADFITNKRALGRKRDLADLEALGQ